MTLWEEAQLAAAGASESANKTSSESKEMKTSQYLTMVI